MIVRRSLWCLRLAAIAGLAWPALLATQAKADLLITPQRVVFEPRDRTAVLTLLNNGADPATYRISWKQMRQLPDGQFQEIEAPGEGEAFADGLVRYSPRQVTLEPGEQQVVRLLVRRPPDLAAGEYRSHLTFSAEPQLVGGKATRPKAIGVQLAIVYGISLPVIVRQGQLAATTALDFAVKRTAHGLDVDATIRREGNESVYGDIEVHYLPPRGEPVLLAETRGISVLTPLGARRVVVSATLPPELNIAGGQFRVTYRKPPDQGGDILAEAVQPAG